MSANLNNEVAVRLYKNQPVEDLRKARHCIEMLIDIEMQLIEEDEKYYHNALTRCQEAKKS